MFFSASLLLRMNAMAEMFSNDVVANMGQACPDENDGSTNQAVALPEHPHLFWTQQVLAPLYTHYNKELEIQYNERICDMYYELLYTSQYVSEEKR